MKTDLLLAGLFLAAMPLSAAAASPAGERFAAALFARWCGDGSNVIFSPFSLSSALAMTAAGARGETAAQIAAALDLSAGPEQLAEAFAALDKQFDAARRDSPGLAFSVANAIFPQQTFAVRPEFLETVRTRFKGEAMPLDYLGNPEAARRTINAWVEAQTANRIRDLIAPGILTPMTRMTLVNAIYFKGAWATPFDVNLTKPAPFTAPGNVTVQAPLMQRQGRMPYAEINGMQAVELPYAGHRFSMLVLLPPAGGSLGDIAGMLTANGLRDWAGKAETTDVMLFLPRFTCTWERECTRTLADLGIVNLFDAARADLSGLAGNPGELVVSAVIHKAFIEVTEAGTEAAAATAVAVRMTSMQPEERRVVFRADRPFAYLIREQASGAILFAGVVVKP